MQGTASKKERVAEVPRGECLHLYYQFTGDRGRGSLHSRFWYLIIVLDETKQNKQNTHKKK